MVRGQVLRTHRVRRAAVLRRQPPEGVIDHHHRPLLRPPSFAAADVVRRHAVQRARRQPVPGVVGERELPDRRLIADNVTRSSKGAPMTRRDISVDENRGGFCAANEGGVSR
jgi:hypothetical protein